MDIGAELEISPDQNEVAKSKKAKGFLTLWLLLESGAVW